MYYSLAIVLERDIKNGSFFPSYVLCQSNTMSDKRSGWRVVKQFNGTSNFNLQKVLVTSMFGHDDMLDYLSDYRTQDKMRGVHYHPKGALCWFETNQYGDPTGSLYIARMIPDMKLLELPRKERGYQQLLKKYNKKPTTKELLTREKPDTEEIAVVKPILHKMTKGEK